MLPESIRSALEREAHIVDRVKSKTLTRFPPPSAEGGGSLYEVDLNVPEIAFYQKRKRRLFGRGGGATERFPVQVIGSYSNITSTWMWGFVNDTLPVSGYDRIEAAIRALPEVAPMLAQKTTDLKNEQDAFALACWVAARVGWLGAFPHTNEHGYIFLALKVGEPGTSAASKDQLWCTTCGRSAAKTRQWEFAPGFAICEECVAGVRDILDEIDPNVPPSPFMAPPSTVCVVCGQRERAVGFPYAWLGFRCAAEADRRLNAH